MDQILSASMRRRGVQFVGIILATVLIVLASIHLLITHYTHQAEAYVAREVVPFINTWDWRRYVALIPPSRQDQDSERIRQNAPAGVAKFAALGNPHTLEDPKGFVRLDFDRQFLPSLSAFVKIEGEFPTGPAWIEANLVRENGNWYLDQVAVKSDHYMNRPSN